MPAALHPITIAVPFPAGVHLGAVVGYRGKVRSEHYSTFYIAAIDEGRLTLVDRDYPSVTTLYRVNPRHVVPTGVTIDLCDGCGHEAGWSGRGINYGYCEALCGCRLHDQIRTD